jgi:hypothetical protein
MFPLKRLAICPNERSGENERTFNQILSLRSLLQTLLQTIRRSLALKFVGGGLEGSVLFTPQSAPIHPESFAHSNKDLERSLRRSIGVKQNMTVFEFLGIRTMLQVFLKGVLAHMTWSDGGDGSLINNRLAGFLFCHCSIG